MSPSSSGTLSVVLTASVLFPGITERQILGLTVLRSYLAIAVILVIVRIVQLAIIAR